MADAPELVHGTAIALAGRAALIRGPSGSGKSDLALRCLGLPSTRLIGEPALLVSDDQVRLERRDGKLHALPPPALRGLIEIRGVGIVPAPSVEIAELVLVAELVPIGEYDRLPEGNRRTRLAEVELPVVEIAPFESSAPLKLLLALARSAAHGSGL
jgi:serine kinase of HPr protein (carbohydrate metabolism regulator)